MLLRLTSLVLGSQSWSSWTPLMDGPRDDSTSQSFSEASVFHVLQGNLLPVVQGVATRGRCCAQLSGQSTAELLTPANVSAAVTWPGGVPPRVKTNIFLF